LVIVAFVVYYHSRMVGKKEHTYLDMYQGT